MRTLARALLVAFVFVVPWQYSVEFPARVGNLARVLGLILLLAVIPVAFGSRRMRQWRRIHWLALVFILWLGLTYFWSIDRQGTLEHLRGNVQEVMVLWLAWELVDTPEDLGRVLQAFVAGSLVLALLTIAALAAPEAASQVRFAPSGQDPNDVARFLDLGFPLAAFLLRIRTTGLMLWIALAYVPAGVVAVLLTGSRGGVLAGSIALICALLVLTRRSRDRILLACVGAPAAVAAVCALLPAETIQRILTIPEQLASGDLNQRLSIWAAGAQALARAPFFGSGAGSFVAAAALASGDTAHNTPLGIAVEGGVVALTMAFAILLEAVRLIRRTTGTLRGSLLGSLAVWAVTSLVATVHENRITWVLIAIVAIAARLAVECRASLDATFGCGAGAASAYAFGEQTREAETVPVLQEVP